MSEPLVHVVDDDAAMRDSLRFLLKISGFQTRTYASGPELLAAAAEGIAGCVVTDMHMPEMTGLELMQRLREAGVGLPVIMISGQGDMALALEAMRLGALNFLEKPFEDELLLASIRKALEGGDEAGERAADARRYAALVERLSPREREVLGAMVAGLGAAEIAAELGLTTEAAEVLRANVITKSGAASLGELLRIAQRAR